MTTLDDVPEHVQAANREAALRDVARARPCTDEQWAVIGPLLLAAGATPAKRTRPTKARRAA